MFPIVTAASQGSIYTKHFGDKFDVMKIDNMLSTSFLFKEKGNVTLNIILTATLMPSIKFLSKTPEFNDDSFLFDSNTEYEVFLKDEIKLKDTDCCIHNRFNETINITKSYTFRYEGYEKILSFNRIMKPQALGKYNQSS